MPLTEQATRQRSSRSSSLSLNLILAVTSICTRDFNGGERILKAYRRIVHYRQPNCFLEAALGALGQPLDRGDRLLGRAGDSPTSPMSPPNAANVSDGAVPVGRTTH